MTTAESRSRYLIKSRLKLPLECPTKLFYTGKVDVYPDCKREDEFLQELAGQGASDAENC